MTTFGKYLAGAGAVTREQLEEATNSLVVVGGRLGTNLLELGYLGIDELDGHLAAHLGVPCPPPRWIEHPSPKALKALPASLAERHGVVPMMVEKGVLHVAMAAPGQPDVIDEISFATGLRIEPYVLSEVRLALLLERHMGVPLEGRFAYFSEWKKRRRKHGRTPARPATPAAAPEAEEAMRQRKVFGVSPLDLGEELTDEQTFSSLHSDWLTATVQRQTQAGATPVEPVSGAPEREVGALEPAEIARLEQELVTAPDREEVARLALRLARVHSAASALFVIHHDTIRGATALGPDMAERIDGIVLPLETPSLLSETARRGMPFRGALPSRPIDCQVFRLLGREAVREVMVLPIRLGERVVNLLYVDNAERPLASSSAAAIMTLPGLITRAYAGIIRARRRRYF